MTGVQIVTEIVQILGAGIAGLGEKIGAGVSSFAQALAFNAGGTDLSIYFILVVALAGCSLAIAITTRVFVWLSSLGN